MITNGELIEIENRLYLPDQTINSINPNITRFLGIRGLGQKSSGITKLVKSTDVSKNENIIYNNCDDIYPRLFNTLKWEPFTDLTVMEVFNPESPKPPYQSWKDARIMKDAEIYLSRIEINPNQKKYFWTYKSGNEVRISQVDEVYVTFFEIRRFIMWTRKRHGFPITAFYKRDESYTYIKMNAAIPKYENDILDTYGWPVRRIQNINEYIVSNDVWEEIYTMLNNLNMKVLEINYGRI